MKSRSALEDLRRASEKLKAAPVRDRIREVSRLAASRLRRDDPFRKKALRSLEDEGGFPPPMAEEILGRLFGKFSSPSWGHALKKTRLFSSRDRVAAWLFPSNVPDPVAVHVLVGLGRGVSSLVRFSSRFRGFGAAFVASIKADSKLFRDAVLEIPDRERFCRLAAGADLIGAFGEDETIARVRRRIGQKPRLVAYGRRLSFGVVFRSSLTGAKAASTAWASARDVWLYDQRGCLSPRMYFVEGGTADFARLLKKELEDLARRGGVRRPYELALERRRFLDRLAAASAGGKKVFMEGGAGNGAAVFRWEEKGVPAGTGGQVIGVKPFRDIREVLKDLDPFRGVIQGLSVAGTPREASMTKKLFRSSSVRHLSAAGEIQNPAVEVLL